MIVTAQVEIAASAAATWAVITDIEHAADIVGGIDGIQIVNRPSDGLVGLKWRETRMFFGKPAAVEKTVTQAVKNEFLETRAESDGFVFVTTTRIDASSGGVTLLSAHDSQPQSFSSKLMAIPMSLFFKGMAKKLILQDLNDIKVAAERSGQP